LISASVAPFGRLKRRFTSANLVPDFGMEILN
jgi:hypothetical protein